MTSKSLNHNVALITGASSGIGKEFAHIHAERGGDLVIVARREDKLNALKAELEAQHGVRVMVIAKDLSEPNAASEIYDAVQQAGIAVDVLINNAGFGGRGKFYEREWENDLAMLNLNIVALTALTRLFLPGFVACNRRAHPECILDCRLAARPAASRLLRFQSLRDLLQ